MVMASPGPVVVEKKPLLGYTAALMLHTYVAYSCAMHLSAWLVFHWFGWVAPILDVSIRIPAADWYLQHFELMTILPRSGCWIPQRRAHSAGCDSQLHG